MNKEPERIVVLLLCPLGDTLFATPSLRALREHYPQALIDVVCWQTNCGVLVNNPVPDRLLPVKNALEALRLLHSLEREQNCDLAVGLSHRGSALLPAIIAREKVGFTGPGIGWLYGGGDLEARRVHAVEYCLGVLKELGIVADDPKLEFHYRQNDLEKALEIFDSSRRKPVVTIHPGGKYFSAKRWQPEGFAAVADQLIAKKGAAVVLVGGPDDLELAQAIASTMEGEPIIAAGATTLGETAALLACSTLFLGADSGPLHLAAAVGTPVVAVFGPTNPVNFRPWGVAHRIVRKEFPCSPCFHWLGSPLQYLPSWDNPTCQRECMSTLSVEQVLGATLDLWEEIGGRTEV